MKFLPRTKEKYVHLKVLGYVGEFMEWVRMLVIAEPPSNEIWLQDIEVEGIAPVSLYWPDKIEFTPDTDAGGAYRFTVDGRVAERPLIYRMTRLDQAWVLAIHPKPKS